ncbi:MAG: ROK family protein [Bacteroidales bacterium]|nr:ROK family protein [Bacteroidales bacterium]
MKEVTAGIDIGGTNSSIGLVDKHGKVVQSTILETKSFNTVEPYVKACNDAITDLLEAGKGEYNLKGIGIGAPNANYYRGTIENAPNLPWKGIIPFKEMFLKLRDVPIALTNDANAAAIGETIYGVAKGMENVVVLTLGTGLGSGIVVNGDIVYGYSGFAGEMGHIIVYPGGRECGCGQLGCLETYVSATGVCKTAIELMAKRRAESPLRKFEVAELTSKKISDAAKENDPIALEAFDKTAEILAIAIANSLAYTSPEAVVLFGGLAKSGELLMKPLKKWLDKYVLIFYKDTFKVLFSALEEDNAAILGASALAWKEIEKFA